MALSLSDLKREADAGPADEVVGVTRGWLRLVEEEARELRRLRTFSGRKALLTHAPEVLHS